MPDVDPNTAGREARAAADERLGATRPPTRDIGGERRARQDERTARTFRAEPSLERARELAAAGERLSPQLRIQLGHYSHARDLAEAAGTLQPALDAAKEKR